MVLCSADPFGVEYASADFVYFTDADRASDQLNKLAPILENQHGVTELLAAKRGRAQDGRLSLSCLFWHSRRCFAGVSKGALYIFLNSKESSQWQKN